MCSFPVMPGPGTPRWIPISGAPRSAIIGCSRIALPGCRRRSTLDGGRAGHRRERPGHRERGRSWRLRVPCRGRALPMPGRHRPRGSPRWQSSFRPRSTAPTPPASFIAGISTTTGPSTGRGRDRRRSTHTYVDAGVYSVALGISNSVGETASVVKTDHVRGGPLVIRLPPPVPPGAYASWWPPAPPVCRPRWRRP